MPSEVTTLTLLILISVKFRNIIEYKYREKSGDWWWLCMRVFYLSFDMWWYLLYFWNTEIAIALIRPWFGKLFVEIRGRLVASRYHLVICCIWVIYHVSNELSCWLTPAQQKDWTYLQCNKVDSVELVCIGGYIVELSTSCYQAQVISIRIILF